MMTDIQRLMESVALRAQQHPPEAAPPRIITLSRDHGSGGDTIARLLGERLDLLVFDKQVLTAIAQEAQVNSSLLEALHEHGGTPADAWLYALFTGKSVSRNDYRQALRWAMRRLARAGGIFIGRGGHVVLAEEADLRVRITGSPDACARRVAEAMQVDLKTASREIHEANHRRAQYMRQTFRVDQNDPALFDLIINTDRFAGAEAVAGLIIDALAHVRPRATARHAG